MPENVRVTAFNISELLRENQHGGLKSQTLLAPLPLPPPPTHQVKVNETGFNLITCDLHFMILVEDFTNHILAENKYFTNHIECTEHKIMVLKPANKYQIIW